ncbi:MAG TPA: molybdopterin converting factor subunit 1 [Xanthomonadaceae bacterium]|nr:molybdopterin converting factor subunit 1 [Xanthomonadaceae bacterium]
MTTTTVTVLYFASLRDTAGIAREQVEASAASLGDLYETLCRRHAFELPRDRLRVAVDGEFADWSDGVRVGSEVALIPPVSGG